jgi:O-antigen ligase
MALSLNHNTSIRTIFLSEIILVLAMIAGIVPREFSYLILILLIGSFIKLDILSSLKLFILSLPFFVALPANTLSDSMSIWRILIIVLFLKVIYEKYKNCHSESRNKFGTGFVSGSVGIRDLIRFQFIRQSVKKISRNSGNMQKILKQSFGRAQDDIVQNGKINKLFLLTALFFIIAAISLLFAQDVGVGVKKMLFLGSIFLLFPTVIYSVRRESEIAEILKFIFYSSAIVVFIGYVQFFSTFFVSLYNFWQFWAQNIIKVFYGQNLSDLLSYANTWFSYYETSPPTLRMFSVMPDSHSLAMFVIMSMPVVLSLLFFYSDKRKKFISLAVIFFLLSIFLSGSRGAWVSSIFALIAALYLLLLSGRRLSSENNKSLLQFKFIFGLKRKFRMLKVWFCGIGDNKSLKFIKNVICRGRDLGRSNSENISKLVLFSILLFFILMPVSSLILKQNQEIQVIQSGMKMTQGEKSAIFERAFSISDFSETSNKGRIQIWQETINSIKDKPFWGAGIGNFPTILKEDLSTSKKGSSAHSIYLDIASETGIFGLIVFLFLLIEILKTSFNLFFSVEERYLKIFAGSFFVYFIWICAYGLFDVVIFNDKVLMLVVIMTGTLYSIKGLRTD